MLELVAELRGHTAQVWSIVWRPLTSQLTSCGGRRVLLWSNEMDADEGNSLGKKQQKHEWRLKCVILNDEEDAGIMTPQIPNPTVNQVNLPSVPLANSGIHERTVRNLGWTPDGKILAAVSFDATGSIWEEKNDSWQCRAKIEGHESEIKAVAWAPSGRQLATCSRDKTLWIHSLTKNSQWSAPEGESIEFLCSAVLSGHTQDIKDVIWHPTENLVISASYDNTIRLWTPWTCESLAKEQGDDDDDDSDWQCITTLEGHSSTVWSLSFSSNGLEFASASDDRTVRIWSSTHPLNPEVSLFGPSDSSASVQYPTSESSPSVTPILPSPSEGRRHIHPWLYVSPAFRSVTKRPPLNAYLGTKQEDTCNTTRGSEFASTCDGTPSESISLMPTALKSSSNTTVPTAAPAVSKRHWSCSAVIAGFHDRSIYCVAWHPQLDVLATACGDDAIRIFGRSTVPLSSATQPKWSLLYCLHKAHASDVNSVAWKAKPEGDGSWLLASCGDDGVVKVFKCFLSDSPKPDKAADYDCTPMLQG